MPSESEFESVDAGVDIEARIQPMEMEKPETPVTSKVESVSGGWGLTSLLGIKQYYDIDSSDLTSRLLILLTPWKRVSVLSSIEEKPDLYTPIWMLVADILAKGFQRSVFELILLKTLIGFSVISIVLWFLSVNLECGLGVMTSISFVGYIWTFYIASDIFSMLGSISILFRILVYAFMLFSFYSSLYHIFTEKKRTLGIALFVVFCLVCIMADGLMKYGVFYVRKQLKEET